MGKPSCLLNVGWVGGGGGASFVAGAVSELRWNSTALNPEFYREVPAGRKRQMKRLRLDVVMGFCPH